MASRTETEKTEAAAGNIFIKPKVAGAVVPDPAQGFRALAAEGEWKPDNFYWACRLRDGDVVSCDPPGRSMKPRAPLPGED